MEVAPIFWIVLTLKASCELTWFSLLFCDKRQLINFPWETKKIRGTCHKTTVKAYGWGGCYWKGYITRLTPGHCSFFRWGQANSRAVGGNSCLCVFFLPALEHHLSYPASSFYTHPQPKHWVSSSLTPGMSQSYAGLSAAMHCSRSLYLHADESRVGVTHDLWVTTRQRKHKHHINISDYFAIM